MKYVYFDLETTGVMHWKNGIHQMSGAIEVDDVVLDEFNFKVAPNPKAIIDKGALDVGGVTEEQIKEYAPMSIVYKDFTALLAKHVDKFNKTDKFFLVGYNNASFDNQFLRAWFVQNNDNYFGSWFWSNSIDVMVLASEYLKEVRHTMVDFKLKTVAKQLGIEIDEKKLHDAKYDIHLTSSIYKIIKGGNNGK